MNRSIIIALVLITCFGCSSPDPCSEFIEEGDISILSNFHCNGSGVVELTLVAEVDMDLSTIENLNLTFIWEVDGQFYEGQSVTMLPADQESVNLQVSNNGCSIEFRRGLDLSLRHQCYLGNKVWFDNGTIPNCFDSGDTYIEGFLVELMDPKEFVVLDQQVTDKNGSYLFKNLAPGEYMVRFKIQDSSLEFVTSNNCGDTLDSDCDVQGYTPTVTLSECDLSITLDAGLKKH